jgi:dipeptidyl aminopeptidase/acylaminoacyl peptidase
LLILAIILSSYIIFIKQINNINIKITTTTKYLDKSKEELLFNLPENDYVIDCVLAPNGEHKACAVTQSNKTYVIYDNQKSELYDENDYSFFELVFSPDSNHFAYVTKQNNQSYIIYDNQKSKVCAYDEGSSLSPIFSPDSNHFAYAYDDIQTEKSYFVYDGKKSEAYDGIYSLIFSPNSKNFAYII